MSKAELTLSRHLDNKISIFDRYDADIARWYDSWMWTPKFT